MVRSNIIPITPNTIIHEPLPLGGANFGYEDVVTRRNISDKIMANALKDAFNSLSGKITFTDYINKLQDDLLEMRDEAVYDSTRNKLTRTIAMLIALEIRYGQAQIMGE